ncbi:MAG TPA: hypothetical protein ENO32_06790, partial [Mesoaciditoga lauensis]|nr:hypothetical protein [Mesoaciditoga lauensis]
MEGILRAVRKIIRNATSLLGVILVSFFIVVAICAPFLAPPPYGDPYQIPRS